MWVTCACCAAPESDTPLAPNWSQQRLLSQAAAAVVTSEVAGAAAVLVATVAIFDAAAV